MSIEYINTGLDNGTIKTKDVQEIILHDSFGHLFSPELLRICHTISEKQTHSLPPPCVSKLLALEVFTHLVMKEK